MAPEWKQYEHQIFQEFSEKYPGLTIEFDKKIQGRFSKVPRQIDILITGVMAGTEIRGAFDCKMFSKNVDVKTIDSTIGFIDDINATFGGVVTTVGFSQAAKNRAKASQITLRVIEFESPKQLVENFIPSLDFSDPRNSMYLAVI